MLEADKVGIHLGGRWLFRDMSLTLEAGEVVGISGDSGVGKSTLARMLAGHLAPDEGEVRYGGRPAARRGPHPAQLVLQHPERAVNPRWRIRRILAEAGAPEPSLLEALQIAPSWLDRWPSELSGGELQRVCIARALGPATRVLIADEMTAMLDALTQAGIWRAALGVAQERGLGVLAISHDEALLERICTRRLRWEELRGDATTVMMP
ncbi:ATP-binding cassette domain-containing protein [Paenibacillus sp. FSL W8-1187]|uniref:ABC transporter ATP-binding protein n=1 Tax=Paenibacillus sp. FSL W8-1187 TaxID=2975339 RepID=UPI0030D6D7E0